jgi:DNA-binding response OmpR family regulator
MGSHALLFDQDERTARILSLLLADFSVEVTCTSDLAEAQDELRRRKFDAVFADVEREDGRNLLRFVRRSKHNRRSICFAVYEGEAGPRWASQIGAHFHIEKPIVSAKVKKTLKAAHGLLMREQRSQFRHPSSVHASVKTGPSTSFSASMQDLSHGGAMLQTGTLLRKGQPIQLRFVLPDMKVAVEANCRVTWSDVTGRAGVTFQSVSQHAAEALLHWVIQRSVEVEEAKGSGGTQSAERSSPGETKAVEVEVIAMPETRQPVQSRPEGVALKVMSFAESRPIVSHGKCIEVSDRELAAELDEAFGLDDAVLVSLMLPNQKSTTLHAHIRRQQGMRYGLEFVALSEQDRQALTSLCAMTPAE